MRRIFSIPRVGCFLAVTAPSILLAWGELTITLGPPPIPVYSQPVCPQDGYNWIPGYWAYGDAGYFWVPGTWVLAPVPGLLWTPGYWGWGNQTYLFHEGYWGPQVGFYGGINYGYGYGGSGFQGGYWQGRTFYYNRSVAAVGSVGFGHVYRRPVAANPNHIAFNGGRGGLGAAPTAQDRKAEHDEHLPPTGEQGQHHQAASQNKSLLASANHGQPPVAATAKAGDLSSEHNHTQAKGAANQGTAPVRSQPAPRAPFQAPAPASRRAPESSRAVMPHPAPVAPAPHPARAQPAPRPAPAQPAPRPAAAQPRPAPPQEQHANPAARPAPGREEHPK